MIFDKLFKKAPPPTPDPEPEMEKTTIIVPKKQVFLEEPPMSRTKKQAVYRIYRFIYIKPVDSSIMEQNAIDGINSKLYRFVELLLKDGLSMFYRVPAVRNYFGAAFVKDFTVKYLRGEEYIQFSIIPEEEMEVRFGKELALYIINVLMPWMQEHQIMVNWRGDGIQFITEEKAKSTNKWLVDWNQRVVWVPD